MQRWTVADDKRAYKPLTDEDRRELEYYLHNRPELDECTTSLSAKGREHLSRAGIARCQLLGVIKDVKRHARTQVMDDLEVESSFNKMARSECGKEEVRILAANLRELIRIAENAIPMSGDCDRLGPLVERLRAVLPPEPEHYEMPEGGVYDLIPAGWNESCRIYGPTDLTCRVRACGATAPATTPGWHYMGGGPENWLCPECYADFRSWREGKK
jgi:hypothetical protein